MTTAAPPHRIAIVGSGPAGFYAAGQLLGEGFEVDLYDVLPTPFGLVRAGVAPDHPKLKTVTRVFEKTARKEGFRFFGGVELGRDITPAELVERYHAVVYGVGTATDNRLGIPGEDLPGSVSATDFVAWYNGHPAGADHQFDLNGARAVVVGNGNVALDVARMLVLTPEELGCTDTADHAIEALGECGIKEVLILGRRGPAQAAFTNPELLELGELTRADVIVDPADMQLDPASEAFLASEDAHITSKRNVEILRGYSQREPAGKPRRVVLRFLTSPIEILGSDRVEAIRIGHNRLDVDDSGRQRAVATGEEETIPCDLVVRSIGYRGVPIEGIPFDERRGLIRNDGGRVTNDDGTLRPHEYAVGWIKRGPSGVIGTNKKCAAETVAKIVEDRAAGLLDAPARPSGDEIESWLRDRLPDLVSWDGWQLIDSHETSLGEPYGRPRVKLVRRTDHEADARRRGRPSVEHPRLSNYTWRSPGGRSSVGRAPGCGPGGRGFESRRSPSRKCLQSAGFRGLSRRCLRGPRGTNGEQFSSETFPSTASYGARFRQSRRASAASADRASRAAEASRTQLARRHPAQLRFARRARSITLPGEGDAVLSIGKLVHGQERYYERTVAQGGDDYYSGRGEAPGEWVGARRAGARARGPRQRRAADRAARRRRSAGPAAAVA